MANVNEKVRIPKEVADAIESLRKDSHGPRCNQTLIDWVIKPAEDALERRKILQEYGRNNFDTLVSALYIGYEIEQPPKKITLELTPEELGTIACAMGATTTCDVRESAAFNRVKIVDEQYPLYIRLKALALEEARA